MTWPPDDFTNWLRNVILTTYWFSFCQCEVFHRNSRLLRHFGHSLTMSTYPVNTAVVDRLHKRAESISSDRPLSLVPRYTKWDTNFDCHFIYLPRMIRPLTCLQNLLDIETFLARVSQNYRLCISQMKEPCWMHRTMRTLDTLTPFGLCTDTPNLTMSSPMPDDNSLSIWSLLQENWIRLFNWFWDHTRTPFIHPILWHHFLIG